ncbi:MAG: hypothetical protein SLAVMIC_00215 [uncultured marine phage]|uniref:Uncharacterized protein n=1 Tax=uncultured marine phage TaxID=707152 RepID=A0A8D9C8J3_9VIRU|nr:MAG: hypothetical protein SLAVMIC_00215 [uncultured marine phage]
MKIEKLNEHTQRTNDQISPKDGQEYTPEVLSKMSLEELEKVRKEMQKRYDQRGSSRPVTHAKTWLDNKKNETDYLSMVRDAIADKLEESVEEDDNNSVKTFEDFLPTNEELDKPRPEKRRSEFKPPVGQGDNNQRYKDESDKSIIYDSETDKDICMYFDDETRDLILRKLNN